MAPTERRRQLRRRPRLSTLGPLLLGALLVGCPNSPDESVPDARSALTTDQPAAAPTGPAGARWDIVETLRDARDLSHHPSDGGGHASIESSEPATIVAGGTGRFTLLYEVGPHGVATDGMIFLQVSPFWGWSTPQVERETAPGYTTVTPIPEDIALEPETLDRQLLGIRNVGRPLVEGDKIRLVYGARAGAARVDRYAERGARFWIAVDGDGDGVRAVLRDSPSVDVAAGPPGQMVITAPTVARPGAPLRLTVAILDAAGNAGHPVAGTITIDDPPDGVSVEGPLALTPADRGRGTLTATATEPGVLRLHVTGPGGLRAESNPIVVSAEAPRVLWADLHGHSHLSDGTGTPADYFTYARDVAALDVAALTDHDHWGILTLDEEPTFWETIRAATARFHAPGRFVTLLGYEWTSWIYGHRHVLYFEDEGDVLSSIDPRYESPRQLWEALAGRRAMTFAHHSAGGPIPTDWTIPPDPVLEPITEIASVHGSSEAQDTPSRIYAAIPGNFVRDALDRGYRLGFVGSGDSHDGHPGLAHLASPAGGVAAIIADEATRPAILQALRARRTYATNGPRILLQVALGAHPMGSTIAAPDDDTLIARVVAVNPLARIDVIRSGAVAASFRGDGARESAVQHKLADLRSGEYVYVRAVQHDGGAAWSSPIFIE